MQKPQPKTCPFCGSSEVVLEPGGMLWKGMSYSDPQFWTLKHWGSLSQTDSFPKCVITIRERTEKAALEAWNRGCERHEKGVA